MAVFTALTLMAEQQNGIQPIKNVPDPKSSLLKQVEGKR